MEESGVNRALTSEPGPDLEALVAASLEAPMEARLAPGERRRVAILFVELQDLYTWSEILNSDEMNRVLDKVYTVFSGIVASFGGYVDRTEGAILRALFGNRAASEMDGQRAVRAALDMFEKLHQINRYLSNRQIHLDIKAGVHIGGVEVDELGQLKGGAAVNIAAGLKAAAAVNNVLVSQSTREELGDVFLFEHLGRIHLKGQIGPMEAQRVIGVNPRGKGRWNRSSLVRRSQFVGRVRVLNRLEAAYQDALDPEAWRYQSEPYATRRRWVMPTVVGLRGAAGAGKSRIILELRRRIGRGLDSPIPCLGGRADPLAHVPYGLFVDLLKDLTGIQGADSSQVRRRKLQALTRPLSLTDPTLKAYIPVIGYLLGIRFEDPQLEAAGPQGLQAEIHIALTALIRAMATHVHKHDGVPLIIQLFDLHAADARSEATLLAILERLHLSVPLLVIATYRDGYRPPREIGLSCRFTQHSLGPLKREDVGTLVSSMLDGYALPEGLIRRLSRLSGGNPYFVEELVRNLAEEGALVKGETGWRLDRPEVEITFPHSLGGLILARVDTLPKEVRDTLVYASAIGAVFQRALLAEVARRLGAPSVEPHLKVLVEERHIRRIPAAREESYSFPNLLSREAVYASLLPENARVLHGLIGESVVSLYRASLDEHYGNLGRHFRLAHEKTKAARFYALAAEQAHRENSLDLVLDHCRSLVRLGVEGETLIRARHRMAHVLHGMGRLREAADTLSFVLPLPGQEASFAGGRGLLVDVLLEQGAIQLHLGTRDESLALRALAEAEALGDDRRCEEARILRVRCLGLLGRFDDARAEIQTLADRGEGSRSGALATGRIPSLRGRLALQEGDLDRAKTRLEEALRIHLDRGDKPARFEDLCDLVEVLLRAGRIPEAQLRMGEALTLSDEVHGGLARQSTLLQGAVKVALGDDSGLSELERGLEAAEAAGDRTAQARGHRLMATVLERRGDGPEAAAHARRAAELWEV